MSNRSPAVLYYISGHGFGHARRCAETIRQLSAEHPEIPVCIRTMAAQQIFDGLPANCHYEQVPIDRGAVERDALTIDWPATLATVRELIATKDPLVEREARFIREHNVKLIIADVPFLAGYVAEAAGVPCYAQSNFLWDWIYEAHTDDQDLLEAVRTGYRLMGRQLRLPFPHSTAHFHEVHDIPFITSPLTMTKSEARARLGIGKQEPRPVILIGMRGGTDPKVLGPLGTLACDYLFLAPEAELKPLASCPSNVLPWPSSIRFWDAMQICDAVLSKPGHGIITDCATLGVALLHPPRNGFREDPMILEGGRQFFREQLIPLPDYEAGNWKPRLDTLLSKPKPQPASNTAGREHVSRWIASQLT